MSNQRLVKSRKLAEQAERQSQIRPTTPREALLREAIQITTNDRNKDHGDPEDNFANIAEYWVAYCKQRFGVLLDMTPQDVAHFMVLMKMARLATNPGHRDSLVDVAGYAACAADCQVASYRNQEKEAEAIRR